MCPFNHSFMYFTCSEECKEMLLFSGTKISCPMIFLYCPLFKSIPPVRTPSFLVSSVSRTFSRQIWGIGIYLWGTSSLHCCLELHSNLIDAFLVSLLLGSFLSSKSTAPSKPHSKSSAICALHSLWYSANGAAKKYWDLLLHLLFFFRWGVCREREELRLTWEVLPNI